MGQRTKRTAALVHGAQAVMFVSLTLVSAGLVGPAGGPAKPVLESKEHKVAEGRVRPGFHRVLDTGLKTQLVGFTWADGGEGAVEVRTLDGSGSRSWVRVEGDPLEGPDRGSREYHTTMTAGPVWLGRDVHRVEVRVVEGDLPELTLHAIRSEDPPSSGTQPAGANPSQPAIVSRAAWKADESFRTLAPGCNGQPEYADKVRFAVVHHTAGSNSYAPSDSASIVRGIYYFHTHTNKWCDIGYNFLVDRFGQVFEGRYGGITRAVIGAHALGYNVQSTGVALMGTFQDDPVPDVAFTSLRGLLAWKFALEGVNPEAMVPYGSAAVRAISGHRDLNSTQCPGNLGYGILSRLRLAVVASLQPQRLVSVNSGKAADVYGGSQRDGARVVQWSLHGGLNQQWRAQPMGNGVYRIISVNSGKVLDVYGGSTQDGATVNQWEAHGGTNQQWRLEQVSSGVYVVVSVNSGKALDVYGGSTQDGASIVQWAEHGGPNQQWRLQAVA